MNTSIINRTQRGYAYIFVMSVIFMLVAALGAMYIQVRSMRVSLNRQERLLKLKATASGAVEIFALKLKLIPYEFRDSLLKKNHESEPNDSLYRAFLEEPEEWPGKPVLVFGGDRSRLGKGSYCLAAGNLEEEEEAERRDMLISVTGAGVESENLGSFLDALYKVGVEVEVEDLEGSRKLHHEATVRLSTREEASDG